ncbi:hypothetical protein [Methylosarcina fibrata]|uniref:hypothetical protein n=1 Tax=Methylosarcina fibrata TaxID=105972 RepID=UPI000363CBEE|nr:hypothetical protein [Methylosarcina fibrata]
MRVRPGGNNSHEAGTSGREAEGVAQCGDFSIEGETVYDGFPETGVIWVVISTRAASAHPYAHGIPYILCIKATQIADNTQKKKTRPITGCGYWAGFLFELVEAATTEKSVERLYFQCLSFL